MFFQPFASWQPLRIIGFLKKIIKGTALDPNWSNDCLSLQGGRGQWAVYYTSSQKFYNNVFKFVTLGTFIDFWLVGSFSLVAKRFNPPIVYYKRGNFVYHHLIYTSIYRPLSYPFKSLIPKPYLSLMTVEVWNCWIHLVQGIATLCILIRRLCRNDIVSENFNLQFRKGGDNWW